MQNKNKLIAVFSNPFGYGPTGKALAIMESLRKFLGKEFNLVFVGGHFVNSIIPDGIDFVKLDERNQSVIEKYLKKQGVSFVISSQNRFPIFAAKKLAIKSAYLDGLSWFWKKIPRDHFLADDIFWMRYPGIEKRLELEHKNVHVVSAIVNTLLQKSDSNKEQILIHLGGCQNPLIDIFPESYLDIIVDVLSRINPRLNILVTGGFEVVDYLTKRFSKNLSAKIRLVTLDHNSFIGELYNSYHLVTTAGQTATLEAMAAKVPVSFLPSMNNSQISLVTLLSKYISNLKYIDWRIYISDTVNFLNKDEREAINELNEYAKKVNGDQILRERMIKDIVYLIEQKPDIKQQTTFIKSMGIGGADEIAKFLVTKWQLI